MNTYNLEGNHFIAFLLHSYFLSYLPQMSFILLWWSKWPYIHQQRIP